MFNQWEKFNRKITNLHKVDKRFIYQRKKYSNPFFRKKRKISYFNWRLKLIIVEVLALVGGFTWFFCFSPVFAINNIAISGVGRVSNKEIEDLILEQKKERLGTQKNLILFDKSRLIKKLNEKHYFKKLVVKKDFPSTLMINFEEKIHSLIWHEADKYYYADDEGNIISQIDSLEIKQKNYPLFDNRGAVKLDGRKINIAKDKINYVLDIFAEFKDKRHNFEIERFIIDNDSNTVKMVVMQGPEIYFNTGEDLSKQTNKLDIIIQEKLKEDFNKKVYIDLRSGDKVYYR